jgi:hypothetical protein
MNPAFDFFYFETNMGPIWIRRDQIITIEPVDDHCRISTQQPRAGTSIWPNFTVHHESAEQVIHRLATSQFTRPKQGDTSIALAEEPPSQPSESTLALISKAFPCPNGHTSVGFLPESNGQGIYPYCTICSTRLIPPQTPNPFST